MNCTAAIIAIGTEVSSGEILNSNASWLANKLDEAEITVGVHLAVPDDETAIIDALEYASNHATHILTIGGLGPTTDDFTREVIAKWAEREMYFDAPSWDRIAERFRKLGRQAPESNKQQCFFPRDSRILFNSEGSANGFSLDANDVEITILPGPPRELQAIWKDHLSVHFHDIGRQGSKPKLHTWACLGVPESTLAEQVEALMKGSGLQLGYRASAPVVHVKVWVPAEKIDSAKPFLQRLDQALAPVCIARDGIDPLTKLKETVAKISGQVKLKLVDEVTGGILANRISDLLRPHNIPFMATTFHGLPAAQNTTHDSGWVEIAVMSAEDGARLIIRHDAKIESKSLLSGPLPAANDTLQINRTRLILTELALQGIQHLLDANTWDRGID